MSIRLRHTVSLGRAAKEREVMAVLTRNGLLIFWENMAEIPFSFFFFLTDDAFLSNHHVSQQCTVKYFI